MSTNTIKQLGHFIGYGSLEDWAEAISTHEPVYACPLTEPDKPNAQGMRTDRLVITCSQPDDRGHVHYCRLRVGFLQYIGDTPINQDHEERKQRLDQAWEIVETWLRDRGFTIRRAAVAVPVDLKLMDGWAGFLRWDKETKRFHRSED